MELGLSLAVSGARRSGIASALDLLFAGVQTLDPRITFTRADATSCATYFDSTGRLVVAAANVPRFDYDPATPASVVGGELAPATPTDAMYSLSQPTGGSVSTVNGATRVNSTDGTLAQFQNNTNFWGGTSPVAGKTYKVSFTLQVATGTCLLLQGISQAQYGAYAASGTYSAYITCQSNSPLFIFKRQAGVTDFTVSNISVQEVTFAPRGLLIEESRTNLETQSSIGTLGGMSITTGQLAPDGTTAARLFTADGTATEHSVAGSSTTQTAQAYCVSAFVKAGTCSIVQLTCSASLSATAYANFSLSGAGTANALGGSTAGITQLGGGWYRIWMSYTSLAAGPFAQCIISMCATISDTRRQIQALSTTFYAWGLQVETGSFPTSYIPTTTAAVTRAADSAVMTGTNFSSWFNASAGTFVVEATLEGRAAGTFPNLLSATTSASTDRLSLYATDNTSLTFESRVANVSQAFPAVAHAGQGVFKFAGAYSANDFISAANGTLSPQDTAGAVPTVNQLVLGTTTGTPGTANSTSHIRSLRYYNTRLPDAQLQSLTA